MKRFLLALRAALAAFLASRRGASAPALGPYREAAKREPDAPRPWGGGSNQLFDDILEELEEQEKQKAKEAWAKAPRGIQCSCGCGYTIPWNPTHPPNGQNPQPPPRTVSEAEWRQFKAWQRAKSERGLQVTPGGRYQAPISAEAFAAEKKRLDDWRQDDAGLMARTYPPPPPLRLSHASLSGCGLDSCGCGVDRCICQCPACIDARAPNSFSSTKP